MHNFISRVLAAAAAGAVLSALGVTGASVSGAATQAPQARASAWGASHASAIPGAQLWVKRYNGPGHYPKPEAAQSVAVSPDGGTVFVTGRSNGATSGPDYVTIAYRTATGTMLWLKRYNGPGNGYDDARSVAVSPDGSKVFVTGASTGVTSGDYATIAYNAATGAQLWVTRYNGPGNGDDSGGTVAVSPDGSKVFVTGTSPGVTSNADYATIAYNAATGAQLWVTRYNGPGNGVDLGGYLAVSPSGGTVFVTGQSEGATSGFDYATIAYRAATGAQLWAKRYNGPGNSFDLANSVAVSPGGRKVFVTGASTGTTSDLDYATVAYRAATGTRLWAKRYNGPANRNDFADSVAVGPGGGRVFVTGASTGATSGDDYATVAYSAATGTRLWAKRYNGPGNGFDTAASVAVSPGGGTVFVTGASTGTTSGDDYATVAYSAATGTRLWATRYNGPGNGPDGAFSVAVSPGGGRVFVTGTSTGTTSGADYATVAYRA
jgi:WD40 repeat protein